MKCFIKCYLVLCTYNLKVHIRFFQCLIDFCITCVLTCSNALHNSSCGRYCVLAFDSSNRKGIICYRFETNGSITTRHSLSEGSEHRSLGFFFPLFNVFFFFNFFPHLLSFSTVQPKPQTKVTLLKEEMYYVLHQVW